MFGRKNRIQKNKEIESIFKKGKSFKQGNLLLKTKKNDLGINRFAFIVSKKVSKKASERNRIKRKLREIIKLKNGLSGSGKDNLFIVLSGLEKESAEKIEKTVERLLEKSKQ